MTVVAAYRGPKGSLNAFVVDTVCTAETGDEAAWMDKVSPLYGNTYATAVGDADIINGTRLVLDFLDPSRPNFHEPATMDAILAATERLWAVGERNGAPRRGGKGAVLFIANRVDVLYWFCEYDSEARRFVRPPAPTALADGEGIIFWGSTAFPLRDLEGRHDAIRAAPFKMLVTLIAAADAEARAKQSRGILYPLDGKFSGIALPHKTSVPVTRLRPFTLPESIVREQGPGALDLLDDAQFMDFELPPGS